MAHSVKQFCHLWRLIVSLTKTDGTLFSKSKLQVKAQFELGDTELNYDSTLKILGITMDEQLSFDTHIQNVTRKASSSLKIIREVKGIGKVSTSKLLRLYVSVVCPIMEYGSVIGQGCKYTDRLSTIQRKALLMSWTPRHRWYVNHRSSSQHTTPGPTFQTDLYQRAC